MSRDFGEFVRAVTTMETGGNIVVDLVHLRDGRVLGISEDCVVLYNDEQEFWDATPRAKQTIDLNPRADNSIPIYEGFQGKRVVWVASWNEALAMAYGEAHLSNFHRIMQKGHSVPDTDAELRSAGVNVILR